MLVYTGTFDQDLSKYGFKMVLDVDVAYIKRTNIGANSEKQALKRIRKTNDNFIFVGEVDNNNVPIPKPKKIEPVEVL